jgi:hypothetical protein
LVDSTLATLALAEVVSAGDVRQLVGRLSATIEVQRNYWSRILVGVMSELLVRYYGW